MPELPEVECLRRGLRKANLSAPLRSVWRSEYALRIGTAWREERLELLDAATPTSIDRRGKYLIWRFEAAAGPVGLLLHLGMSGRISLVEPAEPRVAHTHLVLDFSDDRQVRFVDPRRFGGVRAAPFVKIHEELPLCEMGPEPFSKTFGGEHLCRVGSPSQRIIRDVLLDQRIVAGLGNIYVLEALFHARINPLVRAQRLRPSAWDRLAETVRAVLRQGIRNGGTTFRDYRNTRGQAGKNQMALQVYGRAGKPCLECGSILVDFVEGGRRGVYCPRHQPRSRARWVD